MTTKEKLFEIIEEWGIPVVKDEDTSFVVRYEMKYFQISISEGRLADAVSILYCGIFKAENENEMSAGLKVCNKLNAKMVHVKLYIDEDADLSITSEFFHAPDDDLEIQFKLGLQGIISAKKRFVAQYEDLEHKGALNPLYNNNMN